MSESSQKVLRVALVDDHAIVRQGLRMLLESDPALRVAGEARDRASALHLAARERPDVVLLDLVLGNEDGLELIGPLLQASPSTKILVLTGLRDPAVHRRAFQLGATGLVEKEAAADVLLKAVRKVADGELWLDRAGMAGLLAQIAVDARHAARDPEAQKIATLSPREREVAELIGEGLSNRRIAERLFISETTVRHHLTSVFAKLEVSDRLELLVYAYRHKLVKSPAS